MDHRPALSMMACAIVNAAKCKGARDLKPREQRQKLKSSARETLDQEKTKVQI
jgi:hypothetical protein